jgi:two-component system chemotaxis sensor kinase CheA
MEMQPGLQAFMAESRELLDAMEDALLRLEQAPGDAEALNAVFRAAHTIKGSAGVFEFHDIVEFTHGMESVLVDVRAGDVHVDATLIALLLSCGDHCSALLAGLSEPDPQRDEAFREAGYTLTAQLEAYLSPAARDSAPAAPPAAEPANDAAIQPSQDTWHLSLQFGSDVLRHGMDPLSFIRYLGTLGTLDGVATHFEAMPGAQAMDPESCYAGVEIDFRGAVDQESLEKVFEFVRDDCTLRIVPPAGAQEALPAKPGEGPHSSSPPVPVERRHNERRAPEGNFVRVRAEKLDELITLIGELVIAGAGTRLLAQRVGNSELIESTVGSEALVEQIRDGALKLRMVPIGETFTRFNRVVRDLGQELGKEVELVLTGADTELDKSMIEKVSDPLMHLVRNALDHGLEAPQVRVRNGKPARGRLALNAYHDSGNIVIEVGDDGAGLDRGKILARALERGLVEAGAEPGDAAIHQLVMEPGFSTADAVTNVSGRGMGMDVVKRNIEAMHGSVAIESTAGRGTTIVIRLPLTLAIIDGFLVGVGRSTYVVPLDMVVECMELTAEERVAIRGRSFINLRDKVLPLLRLRDAFEVPGDAGRRENIVVVHCAGRQAGLVVDSLQGEFQTVIKPLGRIFEHLGGISGSTILGSGDVALILDVPVLVQRAIGTEASRTRAAIETNATATPDSTSNPTSTR